MDYHHTWELAKYFEPLIGWLHRTGLFSFYIYVPFMSALGVGLFLWVRRRVRATRYLAAESSFKRFFWHSVYFSISWVATSTFGVALKTMIVEQLDYQERKWFEHYLAPTHLYISSAAVAYLLLVSRSKRNYYDLALFLYIQVALLAGYAVAGYRVVNEDIEGAIGGALLVLFFLVCNYDLVSRLRKSLPAGISARSQGEVVTRTADNA